MATISTAPLKNALASLRRGYVDNPSEIVRDGIIQRFEFSIEQCWRCAQKVLFANSIETDTPKNIFRELAKLGWIESAEPWFLYLKARNQTSYTYKEEIAKQVFSIIADFMHDAEKLLVTLDQKK